MLKKHKVKAYSMCDDQNLQFHKKDILKTKKRVRDRQRNLRVWGCEIKIPR